MADQFFTLPGGIFLADTPASFANVADLLGAGNTLTELDAMIITPNRAPIGFLVFMDTLTPAPGESVSWWVPVRQLQETVSLVGLLGAPLAPFVDGADRFITYGWSLLPDTFDPILVALPTAELDILFSGRYSPPV